MCLKLQHILTKAYNNEIHCNNNEKKAEEETTNKKCDSSTLFFYPCDLIQLNYIDVSTYTRTLELNFFC